MLSNRILAKLFSDEFEPITIIKNKFVMLSIAKHLIHLAYRVYSSFAMHDKEDNPRQLPNNRFEFLLLPFYFTACCNP